ncbi:hypothetical protein ElyMa_002286600, partial [Elysia marginata]
MERIVCVFAFLCFATCHGLDFTFDRDNQRVPGTRNICGALTCEEEIDVSNSSASDKDLGDSTVIFSSILSMSVFKKRVPTIFDTMNNKRGVLLGSLSSQSPNLKRVSNGRKVDGLLQAGRAKLRVELVKREDCSAEFVCQVKGVDSQGREVVSTTNLVQQQSHDGHQARDRNPMPAVSLQVLTLMQQLTQSINGLENRMEDKITSLGNNVKDEILSKISFLENKVEDMQKDIFLQSNASEDRLINKLDLLQNKLENEIDCKGNLNKLMKLDTNMSIKHTDFHSQAKTDIPADTIDKMWQKFYREQKMALTNVSEYFKGNSNDTSPLIAMEEDLDLLKSYGQMILNETETIRKVLTSDVPSRCVATQATDTPTPQPQ